MLDPCCNYETPFMLKLLHYLKLFATLIPFFCEPGFI